MKTLLATVAVLAALCLPAFAAPIPPSKHVELSCGEYTVYVSIAAKSKDVLRLDIQSTDSEGDMGNTALVVKWGRGGPTWGNWFDAERDAIDFPKSWTGPTLSWIIRKPTGQTIRQIIGFDFNHPTNPAFLVVGDLARNDADRERCRVVRNYFEKARDGTP